MKIVPIEERLENLYEDELFFPTEGLSEIIYAITETEPLENAAIERLIGFLVDSSDESDEEILEGSPEWLVRQAVVRRCRQLSTLLEVVAELIEQPIPKGSKPLPGKPLHRFVVEVEKTYITTARFAHCTIFPDSLPGQLDRVAATNDAISWTQGSTSIEWKVLEEYIEEYRP